MSEIEKPFDDLRALIRDIPVFEQNIYDALRTYQTDDAGRLKPLGDLLEPLARIAAVQGHKRPDLLRPMIAVFSGTHGVAQQFYGKDFVQISQSRIDNLTQGKAALKSLAGQSGAAFKVYEFGTDYPSEDFTLAPSLSEKDCAAAVAFGMEVVAEAADIIVIGSAGLGAAAAGAGVAHGLFGGGANYWAGGDDIYAKARIQAVEKGIAKHKAMLTDPLEVLRLFGGRDMAGMVGAIIAARHQHIPIILDGYVVCAAAAILHQINPEAIAHCLAGHVSAEPAHRALLDRLDKDPILDLGINIGDGTGGAMAMHLLKAGASTFPKS